MRRRHVGWFCFLRKRELELTRNFFYDMDWFLKIGSFYAFRGRYIATPVKEVTITHRGWWMLSWEQLRSGRWIVVPVVTLFGAHNG